MSLPDRTEVGGILGLMSIPMMVRQCNSNEKELNMTKYRDSLNVVDSCSKMSIGCLSILMEDPSGRNAVGKSVD